MAREECALLELAGARILLTSVGEELASLVENLPLAPYRAEGVPDIELTIEIVEGPLSSGMGTQIRAKQAAAGRVFELTNPYVCGVFDEGATCGSFEAINSTGGPETAMRGVLSVWLPRHSGLAIHASSVVHGGAGFLFPGLSGAGKSTLVRTSGGDPILCDEISLVREAGGGFQVFGSPFQGDYKTATTAEARPLAAIAFPNREAPRGVRPLGAADALGRLMGCVLNYAQDPELDGQALDVAARLVAAVPCFELSFDPDRPVWDDLEQALAS